MGAEQSTESKKNDEKYQRMLKITMEQQRRMYEAKCKELLQEANKSKTEAKKIDEKCVSHNSTVVIQPPANYAPVYPNLQQTSPNIQPQPSTSSVYYHTNIPPNQNSPIQYHPLQNSPVQSQNQYAMHGTLQQNANTLTTSNFSCSPSTIHSAVQTKPHCGTSVECPRYAPTAPPESVSPNVTIKSTGSTTTTANTTTKYYKPNKNKRNDVHQCSSCTVNRLENKIFQCVQGHSSCEQCKINAVKCGVCRSTITNTRNIDLERIVANMPKITEKVNCPNKNDGCKLSYKPENMQSHLKECIFREMECPMASAKYSECFWRGKINQIPAHFQECHPENAKAEVDTEFSFNKDNNKYIIHHVSIGNFNFLIHVKMDLNLQSFFFSVQLIGTLFSASKWSYEFQFYDKDQPRRKFTYVDLCLPTSIPFSDVTKESKCAVLPLHYALTFFKNNKVTYKFYIRRDQFPKQRGKQTRSNQSET